MTSQEQSIEIEISRIVQDVVNAMPAKFRKTGRVEVEVNRIIADMIHSGMWRSAQEQALLDRLLLEAMQSQGINIAPLPEPATPRKNPAPPEINLEEREQMLLQVATDPFSATFDGSLRMADNAARVAELELQRQLNIWDLGAEARGKLQDVVRAEIARCRIDVIFGSD